MATFAPLNVNTDNSSISSHYSESNFSFAILDVFQTWNDIRIRIIDSVSKEELCKISNGQLSISKNIQREATCGTLMTSQEIIKKAAGLGINALHVNIVKRGKGIDDGTIMSIIVSLKKAGIKIGEINQKNEVRRV